jgi:osmotically inducible protein OsmC
MAIVSKANAEWKGSLKEGAGEVSFGSFKGDYTFASRFETGGKTNPEELIAAAHAGCYSMQLSGLLTAAGTPPKSIRTTAAVTIEAGVGISGITLEVEAEVPGISAETFTETAEKAKEICPVSKALASVPSITLKATLKS